MNTWDNHRFLSRSEKLTIAWLEPSQRLINFTVHSGAIYKRTVSSFIISVFDNLTAMSQGSSAAISANQFYYDIESSVLYIRMSDDSNPNTKTVIANYRYFFCNTPLDLPYDLSSGSDVNYEGRLRSNSPISKELDDEQIGIVLESSTSISLENTDGFFDPIYDTLIWENKPVKMYSWSRDLPFLEKKLVFSGFIQDKTFTTKEVKFSCKDFIYNLRQPMSLKLFSELDGEVDDSTLNTSKRRLYGKFKQLQCVGIDKTLDGFAGIGSITGSTLSVNITGIGTEFLKELSGGDTVIFQGVDGPIEIGVESVESDTSFTATDEPDGNFTSQAYTINPSVPYRFKNRRFHIAGHKLRAPSTTISSVLQANRFYVNDISDFEQGDLISVDGESATIKRISGNLIVTRSNLQGGTPVGGEVVTKNPVSKVYYGSRELIIDRDWTLTNTTEAIIEIDPLAEFNIQKQINLPNDAVFTNASRVVATSLFDFKNEVNPRDWIRSGDVTHTVWYEILSVKEGEVLLRVPYAGSTITNTGKKKNVSVIDDDSVVVTNCVGIERGGVWIKNASLAVKDILENDASLVDINTASFIQSEFDAPEILSLAIPESIGSTAPTIRDTISKINQSVLGSLVTNSDFEISYNVLNAERPTNGVVYSDDDIAGQISVSSKNEIVETVSAKYRNFTDIFTGEATGELYEFTNDFVSSLIGIKVRKEVDLYLFNDSDAQIMAQRYALFNSLSRSIVRLKSKLLFSTTSLNDKVSLSLRRLYNRFGSDDRSKIGIVNKVTFNGKDSDIEINDLGNIFNRVGAIADDASNDFTASSDSEKLLNGYIVDDDLEVPDVTSDAEIYQNLIG